MNNSIHTCDITLNPFDNRRLNSLCGRFDEHLRYIERRLGIEINNRGNNFQLIGDPNSVDIATQVLKNLYEETHQKDDLTPSQVHLSLQQFGGHSNKEIDTKSVDATIKTRTGEVKPRSKNQSIYVRNILSYDINFGIGPAGTGKTFLAVASAVSALEQEKIRRIILVRPAVEAGERLGFLPGDLAQKIDPYLRPLYDALYELIGFEKVSKLLDRQIIEIASLAYMRGRTLNDSFIILDEGQNATMEQMKMFLTRIGFNSTAVITGDITQVDLPKGRQSGLRQVIGMLKNVSGISFTFFQSIDVVRHPLVQKIIEAYEIYEEEASKIEGMRDEY